MPLPRIARWLALAGLAFGAGSVSRSRSAAVPASAPTAPQRLQVQGVASCAASGCHHGNGPSGTRGSEYSTWIIEDAHARAFDVLRGERSTLIERNLHRRTGTKEVQAETDALCLNCHVQPDALTTPHGPRFALADGVGCESCHGPAQQWLAPHAAWKGLAAVAKQKAYAAHGMVWLRDPAMRVQVCVTCHVGTAQADVNHDLIAAGHPRLTFEFAAFQAHAPRHWDEKAVRAQYPDFDARAWAVGKVACARAALNLLAARAEPARKPWPEFAEYDCFACHHELRPPSQRPRRAFAGAPGVAPWTDWPYAVLPQALAFAPDETPVPVLDGLAELRREMRRPLPDAARVSLQARNSAERLQHWLDRADKGKYGDADLLLRTRNELRALDDGWRDEWEASSQRYLGMAALFQAQRALKQAAATREFQAYLQQRVNSLRFPRGFDSPRAPGRD